MVSDSGDGRSASAGLDRRQFLVASAGAVAVGLAGSSPAVAQDAASLSEWGWPKTRKQVSTASVDYLKSKGWWPMRVAWNPNWSDGNAVLFAMQHFKLLEARGLEVQYPSFLAAGVMNEAFIPGTVQVAQAGSLGLLRLIDLKIPTAAVASYPAQRSAFLVPPGSPLKSLADLKDQKVLKRPAICGVTIGSTNHLALLIAAKVIGLVDGRDYTLKNISPADIVTMPKGIDVTGIWEPNVLLMTEFLKNARILESMEPYKFDNGYSYMRGEIAANARDVVQAYADAFVEARLMIRYRPDEFLAAFVAHDSQRGRDPMLLKRDVETHVLNPKPTLNFPFPDRDGFFAGIEAFQADVMTEAGVLRRAYSKDDFLALIRPEFLTASYETIGWKVPERPVFLPPGWTGKAGHPPYPPYGIAYLGKQPFPEPGDLSRPWTFAGQTYRP